MPVPRPFRHIEPSLAKQVAEGDACPISLLPMEDINPSFVPRALKAIPMNVVTLASSAHRPDKGKGRAKDPAPAAAGKHGASAAGPLHRFFGKSARGASRVVYAFPAPYARRRDVCSLRVRAPLPPQPRPQPHNRCAK